MHFGVKKDGVKRLPAPCRPSPPDEAWRSPVRADGGAAICWWTAGNRTARAGAGHSHPPCLGFCIWVFPWESRGKWELIDLIKHKPLSSQRAALCCSGFWLQAAGTKSSGIYWKEIWCSQNQQEAEEQAWERAGTKGFPTVDLWSKLGMATTMECCPKRILPVLSALPPGSKDRAWLGASCLTAPVMSWSLGDGEQEDVPLGIQEKTVTDTTVLQGCYIGSTATQLPGLCLRQKGILILYCLTVTILQFTALSNVSDLWGEAIRAGQLSEDCSMLMLTTLTLFWSIHW